MVGKFFSSAIFDILNFYVTELFPTSARNTAVGLSSSMGRIGGVIGLGLLYTRDVWVPLPFALMGTLAVVAGGLALLLPETRGFALPESVEDAVKIERRGK